MHVKHFEARKREHISLSLDTAHQARGFSGLEQVHLVHEALPDLDFEQVDLTTPCLGKKLSTPFYVAGMTAGHDGAFELNRTLALACQKRGWAMGVGSQRRQLTGQKSAHDPILQPDQWKKLRDEVPDLMLFANLGISQLISAKMTDVCRIIDSIDARALIIHLNALQEVIQKEGTPQFRGGLAVLKRYAQELSIPVIVKETGCGFSRSTLKRLAPLGLSAIDVSGLGGTHWGRIEGARAGENTLQAEVAQTFATWGESTVSSVCAAKEILPLGMEIWASGGVRSGLDAAKLVALGAHRVGYAQPALEGAMQGLERLEQWMELQEYEFKVALFCTGSSGCEELRRKEVVWRISNV
jgi:isopentenyl-diphosphate Delta-isomerase